MKVLIVTHYFPPEIGAPQARLSELAGAWATAGDEVTVLTGMPNHPTGIVPPAYRRRLRVEEMADGYRIVRSWLYATPNEGFVKKSLGHLSFMVSSVALGAARVGPVDVVLVSSPTFFSIFGAWVISRLRKTPLVLDIRDLWPAIFVELGVLTDHRIIALLEALERWAYRQAAEVVVVTEGFRRNLTERGVNAAKLTVIPNGADIERFSPGGDPTAGRFRLKAQDGEVIALYLGAHGLSQGLDTLVEAAALLAETGAPVRLAMVGEGAKRAEIEAHVRRRRLRNVTMLPGVSRDEVPALLAAADICVVTLRDIPLFSTFIPSKIFEYLAAGKPVIGALRGEAASILSAAGAVVVAPGDAVALSSAIENLANDRAKRERMAQAGRQYALGHFDRRKLADRYRAVLARCTTAQKG
ncbi:glycosyltransferase family 4 protein [Acidiferrimicrobium sp. IK]|uniref:glycosyltransferase family 4 protein n=1 Tax=Acidiferrimicrobium sp. IK TaxID=2871700 RepID=UPI0021CAE8C2|nr:glycosyltransferase family 4 protein [Acidiferrimicrobium sp. IK]MCU4187256.1 glycosyltransferase family 4 protein [Acidiferrimicrobium sp. IK]